LNLGYFQMSANADEYEFSLSRCERESKCEGLVRAKLRTLTPTLSQREREPIQAGIEPPHSKMITRSERSRYCHNIISIDIVLLLDR